MARYKGDLRERRRCGRSSTRGGCRRSPRLRRTIPQLPGGGGGRVGGFAAALLAFVNASCCATANRRRAAVRRRAAARVRVVRLARRRAARAAREVAGGGGRARRSRRRRAASTRPRRARRTGRRSHGVGELGRRGRAEADAALAAPPLDNLGAVTVVVGASFDALVLRSKADVLLLVHAPWCAVRGPLRDAVEQFGERWEGERKVSRRSTSARTTAHVAARRDCRRSSSSRRRRRRRRASALDWSGVDGRAARLPRPAAARRRCRRTPPSSAARSTPSQRSGRGGAAARARRAARRAEAAARDGGARGGARRGDGGEAAGAVEARPAPTARATRRPLSRPSRRTTTCRAADGEGDDEMLRVRVQSSDGSEQEVMMPRSSLDALIAQQQEQQQE